MNLELITKQDLAAINVQLSKINELLHTDGLKGVTALNQRQYAELLGVGYSTFNSNFCRHPEQFAPYFMIGTMRRWWFSTIVEFHKGHQTQEAPAQETD